MKITITLDVKTEGNLTKDTVESFVYALLSDVRMKTRGSEGCITFEGKEQNFDFSFK